MSVLYALAARSGRSRGRGVEGSRVFLVLSNGVTSEQLPALVDPRSVFLTRSAAQEAARASVPRRRVVRVRCEAAGAHVRVLEVLADERQTQAVAS